MRTASRGILFAVLAYVCWGILSPVGQLLIAHSHPFTLNAVRTFLALPLLAALFGRAATREAWRLLRTDRAPWIAGGLWLVVTFVPFLWSLRFLPATIATLTVYASPLMVAAWQRFRFHEPVPRLAVPAALVTIGGGWLATQGEGGLVFDRAVGLGLAVALVSVVGWSAYTISIKSYIRTRDESALTLAAIAASAVSFLLGALVTEPWEVTIPRELWGYLAAYVVLPTALSYWLYSKALKRASATTVSVLIGTELVATALVSSVLTDEVFGPTKVAGLALVVVAVTAYIAHAARAERSRSS